MKARELRIGNLVKDSGGKTLRIDWFERGKVCQRMMIDGKEVHPLTEDFERLRPIHLTAEWLGKFDFVYLGPSFESWELYTDKFEGTFLEKEFSTGYFFAGSLLLNHWQKKPIQYVHQLQNLFYALTGEELTIKEKAA